MKNMTIANIASACDGQIYYMDEALADIEARGVVIDSRQVGEGFVFIATKGARVDGHRFIPDVFARGALTAICVELPDKSYGPCILVEDSFLALKRLAAFYRQQLDIKVVGITGSVGKTSTKEFVAAVLAQHYTVHKTAGNFNNEVGMPLTLLGIRDEHQVAVVEMGINHFGEMSRLSQVARPDICVMTNIGQCHLENLIDRDGVLRAKSEIFESMNPDGAVVVNGDDDKLSTIESVHGKKPVRFGLDSNMDIWADEIKNLGLFGSKTNIHIKQNNGEIVFGADIELPGEHMIFNAMAATAVGCLLGMEPEEIAAGIKAVKPVAGRSHLIKLDDKVVIDDCYNANPVSVGAALELLNTANTRKLAILGDMFELGPDEAKLHEGVGEYAGRLGIDLILCVGGLSENTYKGAIKAGAVTEHFMDKTALYQRLPKLLKAGDTILVKASHGMAFADVVEWLKEHRINAC